MNLRRDVLHVFFITLVCAIPFAGMSAPEPELDEVIDLTKVVKPKPEKKGASQRESQESQIDEQLNEYGEGGSGLSQSPTPSGKKTTVGSQLNEIEAKKSAKPEKVESGANAEAGLESDSSQDSETGVDESELESADSESGEGADESGASMEAVAPPAPSESETSDLPPSEMVEGEDASGLEESSEAATTEENAQPSISERNEMEAAASEAASETQQTLAGASTYDHDHGDCNCKKRTQFEPYVTRRQRWGSIFSVGTNFYNPLDYEPNFAVGSFENTYGTGSGEALDISMGVKLNLGKAGSIAALVGAGQYRKTAASGAALLTVNPVSLGVTYYLDTLFKEPYVVPYVGGGAQTLFYRESLASNAAGGGTGLGFYYSAGLAFQLDWLDEYGDLSQYEESAVENTFLYVEARGITQALGIYEGKQLNFGNLFFAAAGLRMEF